MLSDIDFTRTTSQWLKDIDEGVITDANLEKEAGIVGFGSYQKEFWLKHGQKNRLAAIELIQMYMTGFE